MRTLIYSLFLAVAPPCPALENEALLWQQPGEITVADWTRGPGGEGRTPRGPFVFVEEDLNGANP
jgi:hypothetical protein